MPTWRDLTVKRPPREWVQAVLPKIKRRRKVRDPGAVMGAMWQRLRQTSAAAKIVAAVRRKRKKLKGYGPPMSLADIQRAKLRALS